MCNVKDNVNKLLMIVAWLLTYSCARQYEPQDGDLLFCVAQSSEFSKAIVDATALGDSLEYDHVAMVTMESGVPCVIEASSRAGVVKVSLEEFLDSAGKIGNYPAVVVKRVVVPFMVGYAVEHANEQLGQPYDWSFRAHNGKLYCSELIYESYLKNDGTPLFNVAPMNFKNSNNEFPQFWVDLFKSFGDSIPQGEPGTNPNDMSRSNNLIEVYRFF